MRGLFELAQEVLVHGHQLAIPRHGKRQIEAVIGRMPDLLGKPISLPMQVARRNQRGANSTASKACLASTLPVRASPSSALTTSATTRSGPMIGLAVHSSSMARSDKGCRTENFTATLASTTITPAKPSFPARGLEPFDIPPRRLFRGGWRDRRRNRPASPDRPESGAPLRLSHAPSVGLPKQGCPGVPAPETCR